MTRRKVADWRATSTVELCISVPSATAGGSVGTVVRCRGDGASVVSDKREGGATSRLALQCTLQWSPECESVHTGQEEEERQPRSHQIPLCSLTGGDICM